MTATGTIGAHSTDPDDALDAQLVSSKTNWWLGTSAMGSTTRPRCVRKSSAPPNGSPTPGFVAFCRS